MPGTNPFTLQFSFEPMREADINGPYVVQDLSVYPIDTSDDLAYLLTAHVTQAYQVRPAEAGCRASAVRIGTTEPVVVNPAQHPCVAGSKVGTEVGVPGVATVRGLQAQTATAEGRGEASASLAEIRIPLLPLVGPQLRVVSASSTAVASCTGGTVSLSGSTNLAAVYLAGVRIAIPATGQVSVPVLGIGTLHIGQQVRSDTDGIPGDDQIVRRSVFLDSLNPHVGDIVIAESIASVRNC